VNQFEKMSILTYPVKGHYKIDKSMRRTLIFIITLTIISCSTGSTKKSDRQVYSDSLKKIAIEHENAPLFQPIPKEILVLETVNDSDIVIFKEKCVVFSNYSKSELAEMEKKSKSADEWETFYDDYSYYANEASQFLYEKTTLKTESNKKYIQFILATGDKITVDRYKSAGTIFFFNPRTGVNQCDAAGFEKDKYTDY
jgi:hypothetical protein